MFLHERFCNLCERITAHINGECMNCRDNLEKESFDQFTEERQSQTIEERISFIEKWIFENERKFAIMQQNLGIK